MNKLLIMTCAVAASMAFGAAPTNEGGEYTYAGSPNDMRTTGQTGDQIWNVQSPVTVGNFYPGQNDDSQYWQIYRGETITANGNDRVMNGNVIFENALMWTGAQNYIGYVGPVKLTLRNGGSLTATAAGVCVGMSYNNTSYGNATVFMEEPSALTCIGQWLSIGDTLPGALWMDGGVMSVTNSTFYVGDNNTTDGGYVRLNGGEISLRSENANAAQIGYTAAYSSLHVSGGALHTRCVGLVNGIYFTVGSMASKAADIYVDGGLLNLDADRLGIGGWNGNVTGSRASFTIDGNGRAIVCLPVMGNGNASGNTAAINLNGGRFELSRCFSTYGNAGNIRKLNFNGGTFALVRSSRSAGYIGELENLCDNVVYPGGGTIDISGIEGNISATFRQATGYGVSEITLTSAGSGYVTAPEVKIEGGSGSGASAYAILNKDRTINRIVVTCRGEGYAAGDSVTVAIASATGSGATATAVLAPNAGGVLRKTGSGVWNQNTTDNAFVGEVIIAEGTLALDGASFTAASALRMGEGTVLRSAKGTTSSLNRLDITNGIVQIRGEGDSGTATLNLDALAVNQGLALVTHTNGLTLALTATDLTVTSSAESPVVNGLVYANNDASAYRTPLPMDRRTDSSLAPVVTTTTPGPDANWMPSSNISEADAPEVSSVNSIVMPLSPAVDGYVKNNGLIEVKSGMLVMQRSNLNSLQRMSVTGGGAFTTRAKDGFFIYGDTYQSCRRSKSRANDDVVFVDAWRSIFGPFADPDASSAMALTIAGEKLSRPEYGAQAWLLGAQSFSGGLNLVNGGVFINNANGLGANGSPVRTSGYCSIGAHQWTFSIAQPIELLDGSTLIFTPEYGNGGNTVSSSLSGTGDLLTSDVNRRGYAMAFTGDHSAFTGDYYIQGHARIAPATFSAQAGICLADGADGVGVIETVGTFTRPVGTGKGEVCWKRFAAYPSSYGLRGGFAARGGDLTVNLGSAGAKLVVGADYLPEGTVVQLQSQYADGTLTFANGFELGGKTQCIDVWADANWGAKTATLSGAVSDEVGGGVLAVTGNLDFAGTLEVSADNIAAGAAMATVSGDLSFSAGAVVCIPASVTDADLASYKDTGLPLFTSSGTITGCPALDAPGLGGAWCLRAKRNGTVSLVLSKGMIISIQ